MADDAEKRAGAEPEPPENVHKTILIILTVVMVVLPLLLGTLRLLGYL